LTGNLYNLGVTVTSDCHPSLLLTRVILIRSHLCASTLSCFCRADRHHT